MIDLNPTAMTRAQGVADIHELLEKAPPPEEKRRSYVGASAIGGPCERRIQYEFLGADYDAGWRHSARTLRIFQRGHVVESMAALWLSDVGFRLIQTGKDGKPIGFRAGGGDFAGHVDRVCTGGPLKSLAYPFVVEFKAVGAKSWNAISKNGLAKAKPEYADQVALYQAYCDLTNPAMFMATNTDTMEIYIELVAFDADRAQAASDRAVAIIADTKAGAMRPRCTNDPGFYACKDCPFRGRCWS